MLQPQKQTEAEHPINKINAKKMQQISKISASVINNQWNTTQIQAKTVKDSQHNNKI